VSVTNIFSSSVYENHDENDFTSLFCQDFWCKITRIVGPPGDTKSLTRSVYLSRLTSKNWSKTDRQQTEVQQ